MNLSDEFLKLYAAKRADTKQRWRNEADRTVDTLFDFVLSELSSNAQIESQKAQKKQQAFIETSSKLKTALDETLNNMFNFGMKQFNSGPPKYPQLLGGNVQVNQKASDRLHKPVPHLEIDQPSYISNRNVLSDVTPVSQQTNPIKKPIAKRLLEDSQLVHYAQSQNSSSYYESKKRSKPLDVDRRPNLPKCDLNGPSSSICRQSTIAVTTQEKLDLSVNKCSSRIPFRIFRASPPRDNSPSSSRSSSPDPFSLIIEQFTIRCLYCPDCDKQFCDMKSLNDHLLLKHNIHFYKCPLVKCLKSYKDEVALRNHQMVQHRNDVWKCYACRFVATSSDALLEHIDNEHQEGEFVCTKSGCDHISHTKSAAIRHFDGNQHSKLDTNGKVVTEDFVVDKKAALGNGGNNSLKNSQSLNLSKNINWCTPPLSAPKKEIYTTVTVMCLYDNCTDFFLGDNMLEQHMRGYHNLSPLVCPIVGCPKSFEARNFLEEHARKDHSEYDRDWSCPKCGQVSETFNKLFAHVHQYHQEGIYRCIKCEKVTKYRFEILDHYDREHDN